MCVAIYLPAGKDITNETLEACYTTNKDSIGYMYNAIDGLKISRFLNFKDFKKAFRADRKEHTLADFVLHFRIGTSGKINIPNCHPFRISEEIGLVHNGILRCVTGDAKESDTNKFTQLLSKILSGNDALWAEETFWDFITETIGTGNKLILLRADGDFRIVNEKAGTWKSGVWFSNTNWEKKSYTHTRGYSPYTPRPCGGAFTKCKKCVIMQNYYDGLCHMCYQPPTYTPPVNAIAPVVYTLIINPADAYSAKKLSNITYSWLQNADRVMEEYWTVYGVKYRIELSGTQALLSETHMMQDIVARRFVKAATTTNVEGA